MKQSPKLNKILLLFVQVFMLLLVDLVAWTFVAEAVTASSDLLVSAGSVGLGLVIVANAWLLYHFGVTFRSILYPPNPISNEKP